MANHPAVESLFAEHLKLSRADRAERRRLLQERTGVRSATVSRWVTGQMRPDSEHWQAIADVLDVDVDVVALAVQGRRASIIDRVAAHLNDQGLAMDLTDGTHRLLTEYPWDARLDEVLDVLWSYWDEHPDEGPEYVSSIPLSSRDDEPVDQVRELARAVAHLSRQVSRLRDDVDEQRKTIASLRSARASR